MHAELGLPVDTVILSTEEETVWHPAPLVVVGAQEADDGATVNPLHLVRDVRIRPDSALVVVQQSVPAVWVICTTGERCATIGRDGDGPGEFRRVRQALPLGGDSMVVWDPLLQRVSVFDHAGELAHTTALAALGSAVTMDLYLVGSQTLVGVSPPPDIRQRGLAREEHVVRFLDRSGSDSGSTPIHGREVYNEGEGGIGVPYSYRLYVAGGEQGLFVGDGRRPQLTEFGPTGVPRRILHLPIEGQPLTRDELTSRLREGADSYPPERRDLVLHAWEAAVAASGVNSLPAFTQIFSDLDGLLWLRLSDAARDDDAGGRWLVVDPRTNEAHRVKGLPGWNARDAGHGTVAATSVDSLGVELVALFGR